MIPLFSFFDVLIGAISYEKLCDGSIFKTTRDQSIYFSYIRDSLSKLFMFYLQPNESELKFV